MANKKAKREQRDIIIPEQRGFEGVWIPKKLYITNKFNLRTKFFVVEIKSLSKNGYCYATDKHFADFLGISERMVQIMIKQLKEDDYLTAEYEYEKDTQAIKRRFLILTDKFYNEFYNEQAEKGVEKDFSTPPEKDFAEPIEENFNTSTEKNCGEKYNSKTKYNNDLSNTDSSNTLNSFSNEKDNSKHSLDIYNSQVGELGTDTSKTAEGETDKPKSNITRTFGVVKRERKQHELKDMPTRTKEIAYELTEDENLSQKAYCCTEYFLDCYRSHRHKEHPNLTNPVLKVVVNNMLSGLSEHIELEDRKSYDNDYYPLVCHEVDNADFEEVIEQYFKTKFTQKTDYGICHFLDENVLPKIMNKCMLHGDKWYKSHAVD